MKKAPEAFRTISEVADLLDTPAHVLRFWESKFYQIRPVKRAGGRRYYRPDDVALINGIRALLQDRGMTIRGAQRILQEQGAKAVAQLGLPLPAGGASLRLVAEMDEDQGDLIDAEGDLPFDEDFVIPLAEASQPAETMPSSSPRVLPTQPEDELTVEMQPLPGYADAEAEGEVASRSGISPAAEEHSQGDGAPWTPAEPQVEDAAMSSDDLLAPLADPPADIAPPAPEQDLVAALLRPRLPAAVPPAPEDISQPVGMPDPVRLARSLRAMPRHAPGLQRDRLAILARRIDILLERMSEASGAGRW